MTSPDRPDHAHEPADLSELAATDALLDRLGARLHSADDLLDPAVAGLAELLAEIDEARESELDAARLLEVLAGRPLYVAGAEAATDEESLVIDLTEPGLAGDRPGAVPIHGQTSTHGQTLIHGQTSIHGQSPVPGRIPALGRIPAPAGSRRLQRVLSHAALPAASVLVLLTIGGGVSAAVTGDPMAPVNGITRVMAQLPGVSDGSLNKVKGEIRAARRAVDQQDGQDAQAHLDRARAGLDDVPDSDKTHLNKMIEDVATLVATPTPTPSTDPSKGAVPATTAPSAKPSTSPRPSATSTAPVSTSDPIPSTQPAPTSVPSTPAADPTTAPPAAEPTPAPAASSP